MKISNLALIMISLSLSSSLFAKGFKNRHSSGTKYSCVYYNDIEYIQEGRKTFYYGESSSKSKAAMKARLKCKRGARALQKKYHNDMITKKGCLTYPSDAQFCRKL